MNNLSFPLNFVFKITTLASDFNVTDAQGKSVAYTRQKMFKLKESVSVFKDESKNEELFKIDASSWLDFSASYLISKTGVGNIGRVKRQGARSIWRASYEIYDKEDRKIFTVSEESVTTRFFDNLFSEIPIIGVLSGYFFNPSYLIKDLNGRICFKLNKNKSFWGRKFSLEKMLNNLDENIQEIVIVSVMMIILLEQERG